MEARLVHGSPIMADHTPAADVSAGDVIVLADTIRIAHRDITAGELGAAATRGGIYETPKTAGGSTAIADGKKVYWDADNSVITATASTHKQIGYTRGASLDADTTQLIEFDPGPADPA
ncbi:DUF2190 family protein [Bremerella sp. JC770]|uniref:DUF2190 family protein n=1 Tax=Bremerella sp. JC770 TaxID=3232137 RepID=UPI0034590A5A